MTDRVRRLVVAAWVAGAAAVVVALLWPLPPDGFYSGDPGLKMLMARHAAAHPGWPFAVDLPQIAGERVPFVDRFHFVHGDHAHVLQAPLLPLLSAPWLDVAGLRGLWVWPVLAFLALLPLSVAIARRLGSDASVHALAASALLANPLFVYALQFWDHVPAAAALAAATALVLSDDGSSPRRAVAAGVCAGVGGLLRPEAACYVAALAVLLGAAARSDGSGYRWGWRGVTAYAAGVTAVLAPFVAANLAHGGPALGYHAAENLAPLADRWLAARGERLVAWLLPASPALALGLAALALAWIVRRRIEPRRAQAVALAGALAIALASALDGFDVDALWHAWPIGGLALVPLVGGAPPGRLRWLAAATMAAVWLTSTSTGGAQWGPRLLLVATPALVVLAGLGLHDVLAPGPLRRLRAALALAIVICGVWTSRRAYLDLRGVTRYYARLSAAVERHSAPGRYVVTNLWWLDQVAAPIADRRTFLVAPTPSSTRDVLQALQRHRIGSIAVAWSRDASQPGPVSLDGSCYRLTEVVDLPERLVTLGRATCASP